MPTPLRWPSAAINLEPLESLHFRQCFQKGILIFSQNWNSWLYRNRVALAKVETSNSRHFGDRQPTIRRKYDATQMEGWEAIQLLEKSWGIDLQSYHSTIFSKTERMDLWEARRLFQDRVESGGNISPSTKNQVTKSREQRELLQFFREWHLYVQRFNRKFF